MNVPTSKILIVDDREVNRKLLRVVLQAEGMEIWEAEDGLAALKVLTKQPVDCIITDVLMPNLDGYRLCKKVRQTPRLKNIPVVIYTATYSSPGDEDLALQCGADRYLTKPAPADEILRNIRELTAAKEIREPARRSLPSEKTVLKKYSELLVHKLEETNNDLDDRVRERTSELEAINKELETFSYSVSHDLRAPLRAIDGFTRNILERHAHKLDDAGKADFEHVCAAVRRMYDLIDALLNLSGITRSELKREEVDLSRQAQTILQELRNAEPGRAVQTAVAPGLIVRGDSHLLQVALENLLGNAWKFVGKTSAAKIEIGVIEKDGGPVYFVKDNGAGFDMHYSSKLFGPFQRLHSREEFPGTGIGLATVQRIVHRHGGRIWAVGAVNKGATFYFTLG